MHFTSQSCLQKRGQRKNIESIDRFKTSNPPTVNEDKTEKYRPTNTIDPKQSPYILIEFKPRNSYFPFRERDHARSPHRHPLRYAIRVFDVTPDNNLNCSA